ncbi:MAG: hypothetical protein ACXADL_01780 [Candidatus Thorarchaeota archaeon]
MVKNIIGGYILAGIIYVLLLHFGILGTLGGNPLLDVLYWVFYPIVFIYSFILIILAMAGLASIIGQM